MAAVAHAVTTKRFRDGTDRLVPPAQTLERIRPMLPAMGITRLANVTGLDIIGVPVVMACRPNSRALAVAQGKGLTLDAAKASAAMESIESYHAERIELPLVLGAAAELAGRRPLIDAAALPSSGNRPFQRDRPLLWVRGTDLVRDEPVWVPFDVVHTDFTHGARLGHGMFDIGSNGLASGNHLLEATSHAICEVVERDASALWSLRPPEARQETRLDLDTVDDPGCRTVFDRLAAARFAVAVWETTSDVGLPCFGCEIMEDPRRAAMPLYGNRGYGCHPRREIALLRALTEAVQSRLTQIAGSRDDVYRSEYQRTRDPRSLDSVWRTVTGRPGTLDFHRVPSFPLPSFDADVALEIELLRGIGVDRVAVVDLTRPEFDIPVVRVVVPGLETFPSASRYRPGPRGLAVRAALTEGSR
jgi:ribosomal protein S12 methylthiotransferase accessory factor